MESSTPLQSSTRLLGGTHGITPVKSVGGMRRLRAGLPIAIADRSAGAVTTFDQFVAQLGRGVQRAIAEEQSLLVMRVKHVALPLERDGDPVQRLESEIVALLQGATTTISTLRVGPEEFIAYVPALRRRSDGEELLSLALEALAKPIPFGGTTHALLPQVGGALLDRENPSVELLLEGAELALAETDGVNSVMMFHPYQRERRERHRELEADIRVAVTERQLDVALQPAIDLATGKIQAFEALVRWDRPGQGAVPAPDLIATADALGLLHELGEQVLARALFRISDWVTDGLIEPGVTVWMNVSPPEVLHPVFAQRVADAVMVDPNVRVGIEVSPSPPVDERAVPSAIRALVARGARAAIGDFGVGFSDFASSHEQPFDSIKLDRSLIRQMEAGGQAAEMVELLVRVGKGMNMELTAQGIETQSQLDALRTMGVTLGQGFHLARPARLDAVEKALLQSRAR